MSNSFDSHAARKADDLAERLAACEAERDHYRKIIEQASNEGYDAAKLEAERDRLRGTLRLLVDTPNKLPTWARHLARAALNPEGEGTIE